MRATIFILISSFVAASAYAAEDVRPGNWQVIQTIEAAGMSMPPQTLTFCHKAGDAQNPPSQQMPPGCKMENLKSGGGTASWEFSCSGENSMRGSGEMTYGNDSYQGTMQLDSPAGKILTHMQGVRLGDC